jgi:hypothetical protein
VSSASSPMVERVAISSGIQNNKPQHQLTLQRFMQKVQ